MGHYFWVFVEKFGVLLVKVLSIGLLARTLSPDDFGLYAMVAVIVSIASMLIDSGMGGALIKKKSPTDLDYSSVFFFNVAIALVLYGVAYLIAPFVSEFYGRKELEPLIRVLGITLIIRALGIVQITRLTKQLKFKSQSLIFLLSGGVSLAVAYSMAVKGFGYWSLVGQQVADALIAVIAFWIYARYKPKMMFSFVALREHFAFGSKLMLSSIVEIIYNNTIVVVLGRSIGAGATGLYSQASRVSEIFIGLLTTIVDKAAFPLLVRRADSKDEFVKYAALLMRLTCFIAFFCVAVLSSCSELIIRILLGSQWHGSAWMLQIIALSGYGLTVEAVTRSLLKAKGRSDVILQLSIVKGVVSISVLLLLSAFDLKLLLWGVVGLSIMNAFLNGAIVSRLIHYRLNEQIRDYSRVAALSLVVAVCIRLLPVSLYASPAISLSVLIAFALCIYGALTRAIMGAEYRMMVGYIRAHI